MFVPYNRTEDRFLNVVCYDSINVTQALEYKAFPEVYNRAPICEIIFYLLISDSSTWSSLAKCTANTRPMGTCVGYTLLDRLEFFHLSRHERL